MAIRIEHQYATAGQMAGFLVERPEIGRVYYPGHASHGPVRPRTQANDGGRADYFVRFEGRQAGGLHLPKHAPAHQISNNLGDVKSLITHPAPTTHQRIGAETHAVLGIGDGLARISVGLQDINDLHAYIDQALVKTRL